MLTILFSTHGFQHFYFPFTQYNATSESQQQYTESIETRTFKLRHPSKPYSTKHILITPNAEWITFLKELPWF